MPYYDNDINVVNVPGGQMILPPPAYVAAVVAALLENGSVTILPALGGGFTITQS